MCFFHYDLLAEAFVSFEIRFVEELMNACLEQKTTHPFYSDLSSLISSAVIQLLKDG